MTDLGFKPSLVMPKAQSFYIATLLSMCLEAVETMELYDEIAGREFVVH